MITEKNQIKQARNNEAAAKRWDRRRREKMIDWMPISKEMKNFLVKHAK